MANSQASLCTTSQLCLETPAVQPKACQVQVCEEYFNVKEELRPLDETLFPSFEKLILACQTYASLSGCRFSISAFDGIDCDATTQVPVVDENRSNDEGPLLSAKLQAVRRVKNFAKRLKSGEPELLQDLTRAFHLVMKETARNSMIAYCKAEDFFPPLPAPLSVDDQDCSWDEVGLASAPVIAQRLYNDEAHRAHDAGALVRAKTASFVVEFADEVGVQLPNLPSERTNMLQQFQQDLSSWATASSEPVPVPNATPATDDGRIRLFWGAAAAVALVSIVGIAGQAGAHAVQNAARRGSSRTEFGHRIRI